MARSKVATKPAECRLTSHVHGSRKQSRRYAQRGSIMSKLVTWLRAAIVCALLTIAPAIASGQFTVVLDGLQSPRGLSFGPGQRLYVAQAGSGGTTGKIT